MARKPRMATLWEVPDAAWESIRVMLDLSEGPKRTGRPRADRRRALDGIIFHLRTGCPWNHIPRAFGDDSTIHRYYLDWGRRGILEQIWRVLLKECGDLARAVVVTAETPWAALPGKGRGPSRHHPPVQTLSSVGS